MKINLRTILFISSISFICFFCSQNRTDIYEIGVMAPFTGQEGVSIYGKNIKNSVELAVEEINSKGGVKGKKIKVIYEDTRFIPSVAVTALTKLASVDKVKIIIGDVGSSSTIAASNVAEQNKVILISPASTSNEISGLSPYVFRTIAPDVYEAETMANFSISKNFKKVGICFVDNAGTRGPAEVYKKIYEKNNLIISAFEVLPQGNSNARSQLSKILSTNPDAVYLLGYALELGNMIKQLREQNKKIPILSFQVMEEPKVLEIAGKSSEGVIFTTPTIYKEEATGNVINFINRYRNKYGENPGIFSANAYDAVYVIAACIEKVGFDSESIRKELSKIKNFQGASGTFDINNKGDSNQQPQIMTIANGKIKKYVENK